MLLIRFGFIPVSFVSMFSLRRSTTMTFSNQSSTRKKQMMESLKVRHISVFVTGTGSPLESCVIHICNRIPFGVVLPLQCVQSGFHVCLWTYSRGFRFDWAVARVVGRSRPPPLDPDHPRVSSARSPARLASLRVAMQPVFRPASLLRICSQRRLWDHVVWMLDLNLLDLFVRLD